MSARKGLVYGSQFQSGGLGRALGFTAAEQTFLTAAGPSHWLEAGVRSEADSRMVLIDRVIGTRYRQSFTANPAVTTGINGKPTLAFTAQSYFLPQEGQRAINLNAWSLVFVCSNAGAGSSTRVLIGGKPEAGHGSSDYVTYIGLATGTRTRVYNAAGTARMDAAAGGDFAGSERCSVVGFDTTNGLAIEVDGTARGTAPTATQPLNYGQFVLFAGTTSAPAFTLPFYGEWAATFAFPYNLHDGSHNTEKAALEAYVAAKWGIPFS